VSGDGGIPQNILPQFIWKGEQRQLGVAWPQLLPGEQQVLLIYWGGGFPGRAVVADLNDGHLTDLGIETGLIRHLPTGHLLYGSRDATLMAAPFDASTLAISGPAVAMARDISYSGNAALVFATSQNGHLVSSSGHLRGSRHEQPSRFETCESFR